MTSLIVGTTEKDMTKFALAIQQLAQGRSNANGSVTLALNEATTTVTAPNCASGSTVLLFPMTANAAAEFGNGTVYVSTVSNGSFVVTHANSATASRTFRWVAIG